ncbi:MAG: fructose-1,6-bisphosphatase [Pseudobutyrivibrio sp.]|nr:fructose-1,6-bisphosphatase [Pseudobutyrivibrio sp.]
MSEQTSHKHYLSRLSQLYPSIAAVSTEIINLSSILNLPKGTEHFITDIHGEYEAFMHVVKNGSGAVRNKVEEVYGRTLSESDIRELSTLIYYPAEKIALEASAKNEEEMRDWYRVMLYRLIAVCKYSASKYTRSKVRKALPADFAYVIEELITEREDGADKEAYYNEIINAIIRTGQADDFIIAMSELIPRLVVDRLHVLGDIYDRGDGAADIMDLLSKHHCLDIQWGNHDIVWMGAAAGQVNCIANVIRVSARYGNLGTLEDDYGINLLPLAIFAGRVYGDDKCSCFEIKGKGPGDYDLDLSMNMKIHKAISIIQFKLDGQYAAKHPGMGVDDRDVLSHIDFKNGTFSEDGKTYKLLDTNFPTVDPENPNVLTEEEKEIMARLTVAFLRCKRLQDHASLMVNKGSFYKTMNGNLLYHGCMPLDEAGEFKEVSIYGEILKGKALYDRLDTYVRKAFVAKHEDERERSKDLLWWIWCSADSPLFGKNRMATFERYFLADEESHIEKKNPYYSFLDNDQVVSRILKEFGLEGERCHIINGHVPVKKGEQPMRCRGRVLIIDGGFSKAYQGQTGIAGYTLTFNSFGLKLVAHEPFTSTEDAIRTGADIHSGPVLVEQYIKQLTVGDTDNGQELRLQIAELEDLLSAYRNGVIPEKES